MSDIFGGFGGDGDVSSYDVIQDANVAAADAAIINSIAASNVDLNPIIGRLDGHDTDISNLQSSISNIQIINGTQTTNISNLQADVATKLSSATAAATYATIASVAGKLDTSTYNAGLITQDARDDLQDTAISGKLDTSVYNTFQGTYTTDKNAQAALNLTFLDAADLAPYLTSATAASTYATIGSVSGKLDSSVAASTYATLAQRTSDLSTQDTRDDGQDGAITTLQSTTSTLSTNLFNLTTTVNGITASLPQTATNTPANPISGAPGSNVQTIMQSLQTNISNLSAPAGLDPYITTQLNTMLIPYLANPLFVANNAKWHFLNNVNQNLNSNFVNGPSFLKLTLVAAGNVVNVPQTNIIRVLGAITGNVDNICFSMNGVGDFFGNSREVIAGPIIPTYEMSNRGRAFKMRDNTATIGVYGGVQKNLNDLITEEQAIQNAIGGNLAFLGVINQNLSQTSSPFFYQMSVGRNIVGYGVALELFDSNLGIARGYGSNDGRFISISSTGATVAEMNNSGFQTFGFGALASEPAVAISVNRPANAAIAHQIFNDGSMRLWGSTRSNAGIPSIDMTNFGHAIFQGNITANSYISGANTIDPVYNTTLGAYVIQKNSLLSGPDFSLSTIQGFNHVITQSTYTGLVGNQGFRVIGAFNTCTNLDGGMQIIGANNTVSGLNSTLTGAYASTVIGNSNTIVSKSPDICLGYNNNLSNLSGFDTRRICIGTNNDVHGPYGATIGANNNAQATNANGNLNQVFTFGNNWTTALAEDNIGRVNDNTILLGDPATATPKVVFGLDLPINPGIGFASVEISFSKALGIPRYSLMRNASSQRYKKEISPTDFSIEQFMKLRTVEYKMTQGETRLTGLIAEEVDELTEYKNFVSKNDSGLCEDLNYSRMIAALISVVQKQQKRIEALEK